MSKVYYIDVGKMSRGQALAYLKVRFGKTIGRWWM